MGKDGFGGVDPVMEDLSVAKERLATRGLTLCVVKDGRVVFETASHGISGFLRATEQFGEQVAGASVADKVVGRAVALLCLYARVRAVHASVMSMGARALFEQNSVYAEWDELVESILSDCRPVTCPFEALASNITDPSEGYKKLKALQASLKQRR